MAPRSKLQFEEIREASIKKIMDAALELFGTVGYESTSIAQIAAKAGISKGLIYNYFESKEELVKELVQKLMQEAESFFFSELTDDPKKNLEVIIRMTCQWLRDHQKMNRLVINLVMQTEKFEFVHNLAVKKMEEYLLLLENLLQQINFPNAKTEARILAILLDGMGAQSMVLREDYPLHEIEEMLIQKYCS